MAQQINLYRPILLTPRRYFSAVAMAQGLAALAIGSLALCGWTLWQTQQMRNDFEQARQSRDTERQMLTAALAAQPASASTTALTQNLAALQQAVALRQQALDELSRGTVTDGQAPTRLLRLVARSTPPSAWITGLQRAEGRITLRGYTLDPSALRPWMATLAADPLFKGQTLETVRVQRVSAVDPNNAPAADALASAQVPVGVDAWSFTLGSQPQLTPSLSASTAEAPVMTADTREASGARP